MKSSKMDFASLYPLSSIYSGSSNQYRYEEKMKYTPKSKYGAIVQELLETKNFAKIIKNEEFFWSLYCSIQRTREIYCKSYVNDRDMFDGCGLNEEARTMIEFIRKQLVDFLKLREENKFYYSGYDSVAQQLLNTDKTKKIGSCYFFVWYILPFFGKLANAVGFDYSCDPIPGIQKKNEFDGKIYYTITLKNEMDNYLISFVPPLLIPNYYIENQYKTYKQGLFFDFTLSAADGELNVNSCFLYSMSSQIIKLMIAGNFRESENKCAHFPDYSISTLKLYIEFLYLGSKLIEKGYIHLLEDCDFTELINFAHVYEDQHFFNFCVNLFGYFAKEEQIEDLMEMSKFYDCDQLMKIHKKLSGTENNFLDDKLEENSIVALPNNPTTLYKPLKTVYHNDYAGVMPLKGKSYLNTPYYNKRYYKPDIVKYLAQIMKMPSPRCLGIIYPFSNSKKEKVHESVPKFVERQIRRSQYRNGQRGGKGRGKGRGKVRIC